MGIDARMLVKTKVDVTPEQVSDWAYDLASAFEAKKFYIIRPGNQLGVTPHHCLEIITEYTQDGPRIIPKDGETFIEVHLWTRYYGRGYERGDLVFILAVADWLERRIPESEIWYGGDLSGVLGEPFDAAAREELWEHFVNVGHEPYLNYFDHSNDDIESPICELCQRKLRRYGWGTGYAAFHCSGCGYKTETRDGGKTYQEPSDVCN